MSTSENKTINYNGMELECIESGYWPNGVTLVCGGDERYGRRVDNVVCLQCCRVITITGDTTISLKHWAILPPKPASLRLTNRELAGLARKGYDVLWDGCVVSFHDYAMNTEDAHCSDSVKFVRAPNTDEWLEPTSDLLEVAK